jgi:hypothetical protein
MVLTMEQLMRKIDGLSNVKSHRDFVEGLQDVLYKMAYYISQSDGVVLEERENWHTQSVSTLRTDAGAPPLKSQPKGRTSPEPSKLGKSGRSSKPGRSSKSDRSSKSGRSSTSGRSLIQQHPDLSPGLRRIMDGSHPSLVGE